jgi:MFS family permease
MLSSSDSNGINISSSCSSNNTKKSSSVRQRKSYEDVGTMAEEEDSVPQIKIPSAPSSGNRPSSLSHDAASPYYNFSVMTNASSSPSSIPFFIVKATAIASLGGILFGYDMGVISCALPQVTEEFGLSSSQQEWVVGILYLGGGLGAGMGGALCDVVGRKTTIILTDIIFMLGALLLFFSPNVQQVMIGRVVVGLGVSISGIADVSYLHEMAPPAWRGSIVSVNEACISLGFLLAFACGIAFENVDEGWRHMFGLSGWLALFQLFGMMSMPESPVWLKEQGREEERINALRMIYGEDFLAAEAAACAVPATAVDEETQEDRKKGRSLDKSSSRQHVAPLTSSANVYDSLSDSAVSSSQPVVVQTGASLLERLRHTFRIVGRYRCQAWIALFLSVFQQLSGQASVLNYAPLIFSNLNHSDLSTTLWIGVVKFCITVVVIWKIEYLGRRFLLLFGMSMIVVGQFLLALAFSLVDPDGGVDADSSSAPHPSAMYLALPGILAIVFGYSASFGPLTWLLTSELFPTDIRGRALGASTIVTYLFAGLVTSTFLSLQSAIGARTVFFVYGLITAIGMIFAHLAIPDTGNKTVVEIDDVLKQLWWWRRRKDRGEPIPAIPELEVSLPQIHDVEIS